MSTEIRFFTLKSMKEKVVLDRCQNGFSFEDNKARLVDVKNTTNPRQFTVDPSLFICCMLG